MNAIILCGGKAGQQAFTGIRGKTPVEKHVDFLSRRFSRIILATDSPLSASGFCCGARTNVEIVADIVPGLGPLGGLTTGLTSSDSRYNFVVACNLPFISMELADYMAGSVKKGFQAVVPYRGNKCQPLHALYSKDCLDRIYEALAEKRLTPDRVLNRLRILKVRKKELLRFGNPDIFPKR